MNIKVGIKSCHRHAARRAAQLATWLPDLDADFFFLVGNPTPGNGGPVIVDSLACDVSDEFENIAPKVLYACKYALETNTEHLIIMDDDTYLVPSRLMRSGFWHQDYVGFVRTDGPYGTPYIQGSCYVLSARAMEYVVRNADLMGNGVIDDGAVGRCLVDRVPFTHDRRFDPGPLPKGPLPTNGIISCHKCLPQAMQYVHTQWRRNTSPALVGDGGV